MENIPAPLLSELEMDDPSFINEFKMDCVDEVTTQEVVAAVVGEDFQHFFSFESNFSYPILSPRNSITTNFSCSSMEASQAIIERPAKQPKTDSWNSSAPSLVCFGYPNSQTNPQAVHGNLVGAMRRPEENAIAQGSFVKQDHVSKSNRGTKTRTPSQTQDRIISERNRREKLTELFIALSSTIPGLKKMDKASVLGDAIKYLEKLQEKVKTLEEQIGKETIAKKSQILVFDESHSSDEMQPEIEARISGNHVLLRIFCEKRKGVLVETLNEIEKLHLTIVNSSVMAFGSSTLDLTIIAQIESEFSMTVEDLVRNLRSSFLQFMRKEEEPNSDRA